MIDDNFGLKTKILEAAYDLFASKGYDKTTVSDIVKNSGSSRGGFYHHFKSKEEILESITDGYIERLNQLFTKNIRSKYFKNQLDAYTEVFNLVISYKVGQLESWGELENIYSFKGNHQIILKMARDFEKMTAHIFEQLIEEGNTSGEFHCEYPREVASLSSRELVLVISEVQKCHMSGCTALTDVLKNRVKFVERLIERELEVTGFTGQFEIILEKYLEAMKGRA